MLWNGHVYLPLTLKGCPGVFWASRDKVGAITGSSTSYQAEDLRMYLGTVPAAKVCSTLDVPQLG